MKFTLFTFLNLFIIQETFALLLKYLVMNYYQAPQSELQETFKYFYRKRDYYRVPYRNFTVFGPTYNSFNAIAEVNNITLITDKYFETANISNHNCINFYPNVWTFPEAPYSLQKIFRHKSSQKNQSSRQISNSEVTIIPIPQFDFNFVYCDAPKLRREVPWNIESLYYVFKSNVWLLILLSIFGVMTALKFIANQATFSETAFVTLGLIFPDGIDLENKFKRIPLLYFWIFACFNLSNHYSAIITSTVISPPKERSFSFLSDIAKNNFTLLLDSKVSFQIVNTSVRNQVDDYGNNSDIVALNGALENFVTKVRLLSLEVHSGSGERKGAQLLASKGKFYLVHMWQFVLTYFDEVNNLFGSITPHKRPVHCYLGKRLVPSGAMYMLFVSPGTGNKHKLKRTFFLLMDSGIYLYWRKEYIQLVHSMRVQDRSKVISSTKVVYDFEDVVISPLLLEGKISSVFFLWFVCMTGICFPIFLFEKLINFKVPCWVG